MIAILRDLAPFSSECWRFQATTARRMTSTQYRDLRTVQTSLLHILYLQSLYGSDLRDRPQNTSEWVSDDFSINEPPGVTAFILHGEYLPVGNHSSGLDHLIRGNHIDSKYLDVFQDCCLESLPSLWVQDRPTHRGSCDVNIIPYSPLP